MKEKTENSVIRAYRKRCGLSCDSFAKKLGIAESTLRSYENGQRSVTAEMALKFELRTAGGLTRAALLPELFGDLQDEAAA